MQLVGITFQQTEAHLCDIVSSDPVLHTAAKEAFAAVYSPS